MDLSAIALQGLQQPDVQLESGATKIPSWAAMPPVGVDLDTADFSAEMVALMSAKNAASANPTPLKAADELQKRVIDLTA
jgi:hypothetical protein